MPIYEYRCEDGHTFEVMQRMTDDPVATTCEVCGAPVQRVLHPVAVHFKGKGFYNTDYGTKRRARELERSAKDGSDKSGSRVGLLGRQAVVGRRRQGLVGAQEAQRRRRERRQARRPAARRLAVGVGDAQPSRPRGGRRGPGRGSGRCR